MCTLYIDLDDTYKDTERYIRKILIANGVSVPHYIKSVYSLLFYDKGNRYSHINPVIPEILSLVCSELEDVSSEVEAVFKEVMGSYSVIPNKCGAEDCLNLLKTEYDVTLFSAYTFEHERAEKEKFAKSLGVGSLIVPYGKKQETVLEMGGIVVDDDPSVINELKGVERYLMYSPYSYYKVGNGVKVVSDWYRLYDTLLEVDIAEDDIRTSIYKGIPISNRCSCRV